MKKTLLLLLVNVSIYGNTPIKESLLKKLISCLCPCTKKSTSKVYVFKPITRTKSSTCLKRKVKTSKTKTKDSSQSATPTTPRAKRDLPQS